MTTRTNDRHLTDAELVRLMDDRATPRAWQRHVTSCTTCAEELAALRTDQQLVRRYLEAADFEERDRPVAVDPAAWGGPADEADDGPTYGDGGGRRAGVAGPALTRASARWSPGSQWLKAAAILVLVAAPLAAFPGVRSWVVEQVTGSGPAEGAPPTATAEEPTVLRFTPDPGDFVVRFPAGAAGAIILERSPDAEAELRIADGDPETVVSASSLEIHGDADGRYRLRLPAPVTAAWVVVGDRAVSVTDDQIDRRTVVELRLGDR